MCVDSRSIKKITVKYRFTIPMLDDMLDMMASSAIFSKIDLKSGYHQIIVRAGDKWKTAFKTMDDLYEWLVMPFGLTNAPRTFMRTLRREKLYTNLKKCTLFNNPAIFLWFVVSVERVEVDPEKVRAIVEWPEPTNIHEVRSFHGWATFYRRSIKGFSSNMDPVTDCIKKGEFKWTKSATKACKEVKKLMTEAP
ncbi:putative mitochondrial protein AtMg00860 [Tasmannia lanceolata]|uniref:putative mitochondrial protein AtMg00860 n=1 Tax=Tasmannia lanceolata TaxID=3420 RepID=UPI0040644EAD